MVVTTLENLIQQVIQVQSWPHWVKMVFFNMKAELDLAVLKTCRFGGKIKQKYIECSQYYFCIWWMFLLLLFLGRNFCGVKDFPVGAEWA